MNIVKSLSKEDKIKILSNKIDKLGEDIIMWSFRDRDVMKEKESEQYEVKMELLDLMVDGNV